jgi:hypothetical protein
VEFAKTLHDSRRLIGGEEPAINMKELVNAYEGFTARSSAFVVR